MNNVAEIIAAIALLLQSGAPVYTYGNNATLNEGVVVVMEGDFNPLNTDVGCKVIGFEQRGDPGYFFGEC